MRLVVVAAWTMSTIGLVLGTLIDGTLWNAVALLVCSVLAFCGGSGMRGSFYMGNRRSGTFIGLSLLFLGMGLVFYCDVVLRIFGTTFMGDDWVFLGFVIGFFAATRDDVVSAPEAR